MINGKEMSRSNKTNNWMRKDFKNYNRWIEFKRKWGSRTVILTKKQEEGLKIAVARHRAHEKYTVIAGYA